MGLDHRTPECTGEWRAQSGRHWRCSECDVLYHGTTDVDIAAHRENAMGKVLKILTRSGQRNRDAGEELPEEGDR